LQGSSSLPLRQLLDESVSSRIAEETNVDITN